MNVLRPPDKALDASVAAAKPTSCEGYVTKRGHFRKSWRVRFLVLDGSDLRVRYFDSRAAAQGGSAAPKGEFFLSSVERHAYVVGLGGQDKPFGFKMVGHAPGKGFVELDVFVDSLPDLSKWLEVAHNALERAKKLPRAAVLAESAQASGAAAAATRSLFGFRASAGAPSAAAPEQQIKALAVAKQTMLQGALKELEGAKLMGREACNEIVVQSHKLDSVEGHLGAIESDLDHGDKLLRRLKSPMLHLLARDVPKPKAGASSSGVDAAAGATGAATGAAIQVDRAAGGGGELEQLAQALGELEAQANLLSAEAVKSTEQIARIEHRLTAVNDRVQRQTKQATASIQRGNIF